MSSRSRAGQYWKPNPIVTRVLPPPPPSATSQNGEATSRRRLGQPAIPLETPSSQAGRSSKPGVSAPATDPSARQRQPPSAASPKAATSGRRSWSTAHLRGSVRVRARNLRRPSPRHPSFGPVDFRPERRRAVIGLISSGVGFAAHSVRWRTTTSCGNLYFLRIPNEPAPGA